MTRQYREIPYLGGTTHVRREIYDQNPRASAEELVRRSNALENMERLASESVRAPNGYLHLVDETIDGEMTLRRRAPRSGSSASIAGSVMAITLLLGGFGLAAYAAGWL